jgi:hypothetical protein
LEQPARVLPFHEISSCPCRCRGPCSKIVHARIERFGIRLLTRHVFRH